MLLEATGLTKRFGGVVAVAGVDLAAAERTVVGLIGPNGAGKTTFINAVSGHLLPDGGTIVFRGRDITRLPAHDRTRLGVARTFQGIRLFKGLSVLDNVLIGRHARMRDDVLDPLLPLRPSGPAADLARVEALLERVSLQSRRRDLAGELSYGEQRRLEIARALASEPSLLLLDEPAAGLNAAESAGLRELMRALAAEGLSIILIEHDVR